MINLTLRERQRQLREDAILDTAHELLIEQGYSEMSMDDLAARVGVSKATLYQHFPSKEALAIHVIVRSMQCSEQIFIEQDPAQPAIRRLETALCRSLERRLAHAGSGDLHVPHQCLVDHREYGRQLDRLNAIAADLVEEAKAAGDIVPEFRTDMIVWLLFNMFQVDYSALVANGATSPADISRTLVDIMLNGIRTRR